MNQKALLSMAGVAVICTLVCSCSSGATHPGLEKEEGKSLVFKKDAYGDWITEKKYDQEQREELEDYESERRSEAFQDWLEEGRN